MTKLQKGQVYDVAGLKCTGWTDGDGSGHEGYTVAHYFDAGGQYLGPDQHGVEPLFQDNSPRVSDCPHCTDPHCNGECMEKARPRHTAGGMKPARAGETMKTLKDLAGQQWRMIVDVGENTIEVCRPVPDRPGAWVGPLATVNVGTTEEDDDGEEVFDMTASSGRDAVAVALLPHFADLVCWAREQLESLDAIHFDSGSESERFHRALRDRLDWIIECVDQRDERLGDGTHGFHRFGEGKP